MYVTRPLSLFKRDPSALSLPPPDGPNSGILVIQDEEAETTCCFGLCRSYQVTDLPFPQNKNLTVEYSTDTSPNSVIFIPVLNQPLSSNQYYCIERHGKRKGEAYRNSKEEDMTTCCFCRCISDLKPQPFDPQAQDIYQQFEIQSWCGGFVAKSVPSDGFPPDFLRRKGWAVQTSTSTKFELNEAPGLDKILRSRLPDFNFPLSQKSSAPAVVGKWYCPFIFIKDGTLEDQVNRSRYYEMTLEQQWEQIFACENSYNNGNVATVDAVVETEVAAVAGGKAGSIVADGVMWFKGINNAGEEANLGLSLAVFERMKWEQERFGWIGVGERHVKVNKVEELQGMDEWRKFGCYLLVERFALKRMDGSLVLTYEFKHTQHLRSKWE
ncbi:hypothetical protein P3X46_023099 [Hevea brasiliensis]|uniref:Uncharacterized protein n=1 Tax=Hevea brasiliensis TaxID=3981 RepID=A0ABQ9L9X7_HEVBR|nr:uncharacterized protein LOC110659447 [Hevea brasiliensis]KAJ9163431.1 hypothetical protein P3X46_023099 [Hevea brasiliensis]